MKSNIQFFLGANTPAGFKSFFDELYDPFDDWQMYIIKGGPGTGKSSLMKAIANAAESNGNIVERVPCSSDPLSLDGVIIHDMKISIADGTAPHIIDPVFPGVCEQIIDLGKFWNKKQLRESGESIRRITIQNKEEHKKCVKYMKAAQILDCEITDIVSRYINYDKIERYSVRTVDKEFSSKLTKPYSIKKRFLSTLTPLGITVQYDTFLSMCEKIIAIDDQYGVASSLLLKMISEQAKIRHYDVIECFCPMNPDEKLEHIIIPELKLGYFTSNMYHPVITKPFKTIHTDRFTDSASIKNYANKISFTKKAKLDLIREAVNRLEAAKSAHDVLESYYISAMDFEGVVKTRDKIISEIMG